MSTPNSASRPRNVADRFAYRWMNSERMTGVVGAFGQRSARAIEVTFGVLALAADDVKAWRAK